MKSSVHEAATTFNSISLFAFSAFSEVLEFCLLELENLSLELSSQLWDSKRPGKSENAEWKTTVGGLAVGLGEVRKRLEDKVDTQEVEGLMPPTGCSSLGVNPGVLCSHITAASASPTEREESENKMQDTLLVLPIVQLEDLRPSRPKGLWES